MDKKDMGYVENFFMEEEPTSMEEETSSEEEETSSGEEETSSGEEETPSGEEETSSGEEETCMASRGRAFRRRQAWKAKKRMNMLEKIAKASLPKRTAEAVKTGSSSYTGCVHPKKLVTRAEGLMHKCKVYRRKQEEYVRQHIL